MGADEIACPLGLLLSLSSYVSMSTGLWGLGEGREPGKRAGRVAVKLMGRISLSRSVILTFSSTEAFQWILFAAPCFSVPACCTHFLVHPPFSTLDFDALKDAPPLCQALHLTREDEGVASASTELTG